jgi:hypothetical protein
VYLLSGGIEQFLEDFHEHVEGRAVPAPPKKSTEESKKSIEMIKKKSLEGGASEQRRY